METDLNMSYCKRLTGEGFENLTNITSDLNLSNTLIQSDAI